jgi:hypothetical protein
LLLLLGSHWIIRTGSVDGEEVKIVLQDYFRPGKALLKYKAMKQKLRSLLDNCRLKGEKTGRAIICQARDLVNQVYLAVLSFKKTPSRRGPWPSTK